jgi:hypothetical protein
MRLTQLDPQFVTYEDTGEHKYIHHVKTLAEAQGIMFLCPRCFVANGYTNVGTHQVLCWSRSAGASEHADPRPGRWQMVGTNFSDLTLNGDLLGMPGQGSRSIQLLGGCNWHGYITDGEVTDA